jgi:hypothetical protein
MMADEEYKGRTEENNTATFVHPPQRGIRLGDILGSSCDMEMKPVLGSPRRRYKLISLNI